MKQLLFIVLALVTISAHGQEKFDKKIIVSVTDTTNLLQRVKLAMVNNDFIVKENYNKDTVTTYAREARTFRGYVVARAEIKGDQVILLGGYGLMVINDWGYTTMPRDYQSISYYKGSKGWKILSDIASSVNGRVSYSK